MAASKVRELKTIFENVPIPVCACNNVCDCAIDFSAICMLLALAVRLLRTNTESIGSYCVDRGIGLKKLFNFGTVCDSGAQIEIRRSLTRGLLLLYQLFHQSMHRRSISLCINSTDSCEFITDGNTVTNTMFVLSGSSISNVCKFICFHVDQLCVW
jgi:hypothetical protein